MWFAQALAHNGEGNSYRSSCRKKASADHPCQCISNDTKDGRTFGVEKERNRNGDKKDKTTNSELARAVPEVQMAMSGLRSVLCSKHSKKT